MKKSDREKRLANETMDKIRSISRHIRNVSDNCLILGEKLIVRGDIELGKQLIANGFEHDHSKFKGIEFEYMAPGIPSNEESAKIKLKMAIHQHQITNPHHVEYWPNGIEDMPELYLAEMVCDIKARSEEFGTDIREYIDTKAIIRWNIQKTHLKYKRLMEFVDMLCEIPFENLQK